MGGQQALKRYFQLFHYLDGDLVKAPPNTPNDFIFVFKVQVAVTQICLLRSGFVNLISQGKCQAAVEHCLINNLTLAHAHPRLLLPMNILPEGRSMYSHSVCSPLSSLWSHRPRGSLHFPPSRSEPSLAVTSYRSVSPRCRGQLRTEGSDHRHLLFLSSPG